MATYSSHTSLQLTSTWEWEATRNENGLYPVKKVNAASGTANFKIPNWGSSSAVSSCTVYLSTSSSRVYAGLTLNGSASSIGSHTITPTVYSNGSFGVSVGMLAKAYATAYPIDNPSVTVNFGVGVVVSYNESASTQTPHGTPQHTQDPTNPEAGYDEYTNVTDVTDSTGVDTEIILYPEVTLKQIEQGATVDWTTNGLAILAPTKCTVKEEAGGSWELELVHSMDDDGKWMRLVEGAVIKVPVPAHTCPEEMISGQNASKIYKVNDASDLFSAATTNSTRIELVAKNAEVATQKEPSNGWLEVTTAAGNNGFMNVYRLTYLREESGSPSIITKTRSVKNQCFRIYEVKNDTEKRTTTVQARHVFYDFAGDLVKELKLSEEPIKSAIRKLREALVVNDNRKIETNIAESTKITGDFGWKNPVNILLDPEEGFVKDLKCQIVRDNYDIYLLDNSEPTDSGYKIEYGKNLKGVKWTISEDDLVTRIIPKGSKKGSDGKDTALLLSEVYVDSTHIKDHSVVRCAVLDVDEGKVGEYEKADGTKATRTEAEALENLKTKAKEQYSKYGVDGASYEVEVTFQELGDTEEYKAYKAMASLFLYDLVHVTYAPGDYSTTMQVASTEWDAILRRYNKITLGDVFEYNGATVAGYEIAQGTIRGNRIVGGTLTGDHLAAGSITTDKLTAGSITTDKLKAGAITTDKLKAGSVTADKIRAGAIKARHISAGAITTKKLKANSITTKKLKAGSITARKIKANSITTSKLKANSITTKKLKANSITTKKLKANSITTNKLKANSINAQKIKAGSISASKIQAGAIDTSKLKADSITAGKIKADAIETDKIKAGAVTAEKISAGAIQTDHLDAGSVTAEKIDTNSLSASTAFIDSLTSQSAFITSLTAQDAFITALRADAIRTSVLTAGDVQTGTLGARTAFIDLAMVDHIVVPKLSVTEDMTAVQIWAGSLYLKNTSNQMVKLVVDDSGVVTGKRLNETVMIDGGTNIVESSITTNQLNVNEIFANSATIDALTASDVLAQRICASQAFLDQISIHEVDTDAIVMHVRNNLQWSSGENLLPNTSKYNKTVSGAGRIEIGSFEVEKNFTSGRKIAFRAYIAPSSGTWCVSIGFEKTATQSAILGEAILGSMQLGYTPTPVYQDDTELHTSAGWSTALFTVPDNCIRIHAYLRNTSTSGSCTYHSAKVEYGETPTSWSVANADLEGYTANVESQLSITAGNLQSSMTATDGRVSSLQQTIGVFTSRVQDAEGNVSSIQQTVDSITNRVGTAEGKVSELEQTAESITAKVSKLQPDGSYVSSSLRILPSKISITSNGTTSDDDALTINNGVFKVADKGYVKANDLYAPMLCADKFVFKNSAFGIGDMCAFRSSVTFEDTDGTFPTSGGAGTRYCTKEVYLPIGYIGQDWRGSICFVRVCGRDNKKARMCVNVSKVYTNKVKVYLTDKYENTNDALKSMFTQDTDGTWKLTVNLEFIMIKPSDVDVDTDDEESYVISKGTSQLSTTNKYLWE